MKTLQTSAMTLMLALLTSATLLAQSEISAKATPEPVASVKHAYAAAPTLPTTATSPESKTFGIGLYRVRESMTMRLTLEKKAGEKVLVRLLNQQGQVLHQEVVGRQTKVYGCNFDFSTSKDGSYTIEVVNGDEVQHKTVTLSTAKVVETPARTLIAMQ
ncbi:hypothetical protein [Salmonirosea aquatica]|uniref:T9SS type A sorting domain-containing protein n=1 Tax=Salmonirosea aquatica TaxID=2654236 RepID=A0A7C9FZ21_9BACT|nr:hypothetical protein [Cytophagaceae bacterium SJW1-29]